MEQMLDIWTFQESFQEEGIDFSSYNGHLTRL